MLLILLKPVLPVATLCRQRLAVALVVGAMLVISAGGFTAWLIAGSAACARVRRDAVADVWPLKFYIPVITALCLSCCWPG
jgi:putative ABC transport system permease protein